jgi:hypothetical protein
LVRTVTGSFNWLALASDHTHVAFIESDPSGAGVKIMPLDGGAAIDASPRTSNLFAPDQAIFSLNSRYFGLRWNPALYVTDTVTGSTTTVSVPSAWINTFGWIGASEFVFTANAGSTILPIHRCDAPDTCSQMAGEDFLGVREISVAPQGAMGVALRPEITDAGVFQLSLTKLPFDGGAATQMMSIRPGFGCEWTVSLDSNWFATCGLTSTGAPTIYVPPTQVPSQPLELFSGTPVRTVTFDPDSRFLLVWGGGGTLGTTGLWRLDLVTPNQTPVLQQVQSINYPSVYWTP